LVNFWKIRANYAEVGYSFQYMLNQYYKSVAHYNSSEMIHGSQTTLPNLDLKPQKSKEFEIGTEAHFLKDRITLIYLL
jgi:outer membrane receptor protein involved in Fe transport